MNPKTIFAQSTDTSVLVGLVGAGEFGATLVRQSTRIPGLSVSAVCDRDVSRACQMLADAGYRDDAVAVCESRVAALAALEAGKVVITPDATLICELPIDAIVEATGDAEAAAVTVATAIENGLHTILVTKETESVVGSVLTRRAKAAGVVHTLADGDQPSLLVGLIGWVSHAWAATRLCWQSKRVRRRLGSRDRNRSGQGEIVARSKLS